MYQINFRLSESEYEIVKLLAEASKVSIPTLIKSLTNTEIKKRGLEMALDLYKRNKIGFKKAWMLSQLSFHEFAKLLEEKDLEPHISDKLDTKMISLVENLDFEALFPNISKELIKGNTCINN